MTTRPRVSVIATSYNHERFVETCLDSVAAQTFQDFELVIMDDCSTDGSVVRIRSWLERTGFPARLIVNDENRGICATRNIALARCAGEFVSCIAGDDYYEPDKLQCQYEFFTTLEPVVAVVFSNAMNVSEDGALLGTRYEHEHPPDDGSIFERLLTDNFISAPTVLIRRSALDVVGRYDESLFFEDYDMWLRLADRFEFRYLDRVVLNKRLLPTSMSQDPSRGMAMRESKARLLLKWTGRDPASDELIAQRTWSLGRQLLLSDALAARSTLRASLRLAPSTRRKLFLLLANRNLDPRWWRLAFSWRKGLRRAAGECLRALRTARRHPSTRKGQRASGSCGRRCSGP